MLLMSRAGIASVLGTWRPWRGWLMHAGGRLDRARRPAGDATGLVATTALTYQLGFAPWRWTSAAGWRTRLVPKSLARNLSSPASLPRRRATPDPSARPVMLPLIAVVVLWYGPQFVLLRSLRSRPRPVFRVLSRPGGGVRLGSPAGKRDGVAKIGWSWVHQKPLDRRGRLLGIRRD